MKSVMFFSFIVRFFIEISLEICICFIINVLIANTGSPGEYSSLLISGVFMAANLILAIMLPYYIITYRRRGLIEKLESYLGEMVSNLNIESKPIASAFYHFLFFMRRVILVVSVFGVGPTNFAHSIHIFIITNVLYLAYLILGKPRTAGMATELFNEVCNLLISYLMFIYTDY